MQDGMLGRQGGGGVEQNPRPLELLTACHHQPPEYDRGVKARSVTGECRVAVAFRGARQGEAGVISNMRPCLPLTSLTADCASPGRRMHAGKLRQGNAGWQWRPGVRGRERQA